MAPELPPPTRQSMFKPSTAGCSQHFHAGVARCYQIQFPKHPPDIWSRALTQELVCGPNQTCRASTQPAQYVSSHCARSNLYPPTPWCSKGERAPKWYVLLFVAIRWATASSSRDPTPKCFWCSVRRFLCLEQWSSVPATVELPAEIPARSVFGARCLEQWSSVPATVEFLPEPWFFHSVQE